MQTPLSASYPVLPLRDIVVFPHMIVPLFVGREKSVRALEEVMADDKQILLSSQIDPGVDDPTSDGIYKAGVLANFDLRADRIETRRAETHRGLGASESRVLQSTATRAMQAGS